LERIKADFSQLLGTRAIKSNPTRQKISVKTGAVRSRDDLRQIPAGERFTT